jgi:predicted phage baseplate assembly protein
LIAQQLPETALRLRRIDRAVTSGDFETLTLEADKRVARARCLPRLNMELDSERERPGHVSVVILPHRDPQPPIDLPELITAVKNSLTPKLLLTTRLHVVGPRFLTVEIKNVNVISLPDEVEETLKQRIIDAVNDFLDPLTGGDDGNGWPFGRNVFVSELYSLIDQLPGVDFVKTDKTEPGSSITLTSPTPGRLITNSDGKLVGVEVKPYELVKAQIAANDVTAQAPSA